MPTCVLGSWPATASSQQAVPPLPTPRWLLGSAFQSSGGSPAAAMFKPSLTSSWLSEEGLLWGNQSTCAKRGDSENRKFFRAARFLTQGRCPF